MVKTQCSLGYGMNLNRFRPISVWKYGRDTAASPYSFGPCAILNMSEIGLNKINIGYVTFPFLFAPLCTPLTLIQEHVAYVMLNVVHIS